MGPNEVDSFLNAARKMNDRGWFIHLEDAYRSAAMQTALGRDPRIFNRIVERVLWREKRRSPFSRVDAPPRFRVYRHQPETGHAHVGKRY